MNMYQLQTEDHRRSLLSFLVYDPKYQLSMTMIGECYKHYGKSVSADQIKTYGQWLCENGLTEASNINGIDYLTLTDRGLEVAKGVGRAVGVRDLRPSELADIQSKGY